MIIYYLVTTVFSLLSLLYLVVTYEEKKTNYYFVVLLILIALSNVGYLSLASSETLETAILSTKISYLGGCFIPVIGLFMTVDICNFKCPNWLRNSMYIYNVCVFIMVTTIGYNDFYYKDVYIIEGISPTVLGHTYGPGHVFFYIIMYGYLVLQIGILGYTFVKKKDVSRKNLVAIFSTGIVTIICFLIQNAFNANIEIMPLVYVIDSFVFLYIYRRGVIYNLEDNVAASVKNQQNHAYVMVNKKFCYLGCNEIALSIFPQLNDCIIDKKIEMDELIIINTWLNDYINNELNNFEYEINDKHYECIIDKIIFKNKLIGYMLELRDNTDIWNLLQHLALDNTKLNNFKEILNAKVVEQTKELHNQQNRIKELYLKTVVALSDVVDAKDRYTSGHSIRVAEYAKMIAIKMGKSVEEQDKIFHAGLLHDVGKIRIPEEIIKKPGKLTEEEFNIIKLHPVTGFNILKEIDNNHIAIAAKYHHERYDGKGYPTGLAGENIPEIARILCVADSYDAMTSNRSYRNAMSQNFVRKEIIKCRGTQFDPNIADIMLDIIDEDKEYKLKQATEERKKVLLVDSNDENNKAFKQIMEDEPSYEIISVNDVDSTINEINSKKINLLVIDMDLADIRKLELVFEEYNIPVILTTSNNYDPSLDFKHGCSEYITKPYFSMLVKETLYNVTKTRYKS